MDLFFTENFVPGQDFLILPSEESRHIWKVLRKKPGEHIEVTDGKGHRINGLIEKEQNRKVIIHVQQVAKIPFPPANQIEVGLSLIRPNRMDWAVEKLAELGVKKIVPLNCQFSTFRSVKLDHLKRIVISALKQSHQYYLPEISPVKTFSEWIDGPCPVRTARFVSSPHTEGLWSRRPGNKKIEFCQIIIGPEGGFHPDEINKMEQYHFSKLHLGPHILRTETAAVVGTAMLKSFRLI